MRLVPLFLACVSFTGVGATFASPRSPASRMIPHGRISSAMRGAIATYLTESQESEHPQSFPFKIVKYDVQGQYAFVSISFHGYNNGLLHDAVVVWKPNDPKKQKQRKLNSGWYACWAGDVGPNDIPETLQRKWKVESYR